MAVDIIGVLEPVEIEEQQGQSLPCRDKLAQPLP